MNRQLALNFCSSIHRQQDLGVIEQLSDNYNLNLVPRVTLPTFFTGDITAECPRIVTISYNPAYREGVTEMEQGLDFPFNDNIQERNYVNWFENSLNYFRNTPIIHNVFMNLAKCFIPENNRQNEKLVRNVLIQNIINLDWCPYYSRSFP
ncbi:MAG TPA: hypothetical protein VEA37_08880, partial [Flavobacterium sp.]|nr:hypothetical protein [Flavobacterium sp.]